MFEHIITACATAITPFYINYAKYIPEIVDGVNIICSGINSIMSKCKLPISLNKIVEFTVADKEILNNPLKLSTLLNNANGREALLLLKTTRCIIWLSGLFVGYLGLGQQLLCNISLIINGFISSDIYDVSASDISFYWFLLLCSVMLENMTGSSIVISFIPFYSIIKFSFFYLILRYDILRSPIKKLTYDYVSNIKTDTDVEAILRKAKQLVFETNISKKSI